MAPPAADTVVIEIANEPKRAALLQAIAADSTISAYAAVQPAVKYVPPQVYTMG